MRAWWTCTLVFCVRRLFFHTRWVSLAMVAEAFPMRLLISVSRARVHEGGGAKISELTHHIQGVVIDLDGGSLTDIGQSSY